MFVFAFVCCCFIAVNSLAYANDSEVCSLAALLAQFAASAIHARSYRPTDLLTNVVWLIYGPYGL